MKGNDVSEMAMSGGEGRPAPPRSVRGRARFASALRLSATIVLLTLVGFAGGFGWFASYVSRLDTPEDPGAADAIIVLTGGQSRIDAAVNLLKSGKGKRLLISGVHPTARLRDLQAVTGGDKTLFSCCVDIDHAALDTVGNAEESAKWVTSHAYNRVILVTNNYHMPRSLLEMRRYIGATALLPYPVVNRQPDDGGWMTKPDAVRVLFTEYTKYIAALVRGVIPIRSAPAPVTIVNASAVSG